MGITVDPRVGGKFSFRVRALDRPRRLAFTWGIAGESDEESVVTIDIAPVDGGSELTPTPRPRPEVGRLRRPHRIELDEDARRWKVVQVSDLPFLEPDDLPQLPTVYDKCLMRRRDFLATAVAPALAQSAPTRFQLACMTLPYSAFTLDRALTGIRSAGHKYVAWGVTHRDAAGVQKPLLAVDASPPEATRLAARCRELELEPVMMFSTVNFEAPNAIDAHRRRLDQAHAAKIPFLITFGKTTGGDYDAVIRNLKAVAGHAKSAGVTIVIKQHGGNTATGQDCSRIIADVGHESVKMCYDAGNVLDYENHDPIADIQKCWRDVRAFAVKDHRNFPKDEDCGIGFGEIDHYKLFPPVMRTGLTIPLAAENIYEPLVPRPATAEGVDRLARRSREFLESVLAGLERNLAQ